jgi:cell pole-organizing protein PopZ
MTQPAKAQEPSMEEILASIRRIISDDDPAKAAAPAAKPTAPRPAPMPRAVVPPPPVRAPEPVARDNAMGANDMNSMLSTPVPQDEPAADILDLTEQMAAPAASHDFKTIDGQPDIVFAESDPEAPPPDRDPPPPVAEPPRAPSPLDRGLMSGNTMAAVDSAFNTLAHTVLVQNARTLEDLVKEMLRPMLKTWLDDNLPGLVERIVRAEIERVSRGRNP